MSDASEPEWLASYKARAAPPHAVPSPAPPPATIPAKKHGPDGRFLPGVSGNEKGRKPGSLDKRQRLQSAFADDAVEIAKVVIAKALDGDMGAASIALARLLPPLKAAAEKVQFDYRSDAPLSQQAEAVMDAVAAGAIDPETGKMLIGCIQSIAGIRAVEDLEQRIIQLEAKTIG